MTTPNPEANVNDQNPETAGTSAAAETTRAATDLLVIGASPAGIAAAVTAAREGLRVLIVERSTHLGGLLSGGLGVMDTQYDGPRAPFYDEYCARIEDYYRERYGADSEQYRHVVPRPEWPLTAEPHVMEEVFDAIVAAEPTVEVLYGHVPVAVTRAGRRLRGIEVAPFDGTDLGTGTRTLTATAYVDATYEGDVFALAGEEHRIGREDRREFGEPHAGRIFTRRAMTADGTGAWPRAAGAGHLATRMFKAVSQEIFAGSTGEGDEAVQAYSYRMCLSRDPDNRVLPEQPEGYDPEVYRAVGEHGGIGTPNLPNGKRFWFRNLVGPNWAYPAADEPERARIRARYRRHALGFLYFLQHDPTVPEGTRAEAAHWGLAGDEFPDNGNFPYELYVREARRLRGRHVFTEHDASLARGLARTPVHADSVAFAEWFMDSHEVSTEHQPGSSGEGKILLTELTRPSQIPYRVMLPRGLDDLIVPLCVSSTHVGWGTLRLEPVWMQLGEAAGRAAALAHTEGVPIAHVHVPTLQRRLAADGAVLTFYNDVAGAADEQTAAVQILGTLGLFPSYDARLDAPLTAPVARAWAAAAAGPRTGAGGADDTARAVALAETEDGPAVTAGQYLDLLRGCALAAGLTEPGRRPGTPDPVAAGSGSAPLTRGRAALLTLEHLDPRPASRAR